MCSSFLTINISTYFSLSLQIGWLLDKLQKSGEFIFDFFAQVNITFETFPIIVKKVEQATDAVGAVKVICHNLMS